MSKTITAITDSDKLFLHELMSKLASVCDGAVQQDGQGFNAPHASLGHTLASMHPDAWDLECCNYAYSLAMFYQDQLAGFGYPRASIAILCTSYTQLDIAGGASKVKAKLVAPSTNAGLAARQATRLAPRQIKGFYDQTTPANSCFAISWDKKDKDFNAIYGLVKQAKGRWIQDSLHWEVKADQNSYKLIKELWDTYHFETSAVTNKLMELIDAKELISYPGKILPWNNFTSLLVSFAYDPNLVTKIKNIHSNGIRPAWNKPVTGVWNCDVKLLRQIVAAFPNFYLEPSLQEILDKQVAEFNKSIILRDDPIEQARIAQEIAECKARLAVPLLDGRVPRDYQLEGAIFLLSQGKAILAYDVGLGKTLTALLAAKESGLPIIVVCPASVRTNWAREASTLGLTVATYSWAKFPDMDSLLDKFVLILDESHYIKELKSIRTKNAIALAAKATNVYMLTGTPMPNGRPRETYPLLKIAGHSITNNRSYYDKRYCQGQETRWGWDNSGASNLDEWSRLVSSKLLVKKKEDCLSLPPLMRAMLTIDGDDTDKAMYNAAIQELVKAYKERIALGIIQPSDALVLMGIVRRCSSMIKARYAIEKCQEILDSNPTDKVLIFTDFIESVNALTKAFACDAIQGSVATEDRQLMVDKLFNTPARVLVTTRAGGEGLNIQAANHLIMVDRTFVPKDFIQFEGRSLRSGQCKTVFSWWLQYNDSDKHIDNVLLQKQKRIDLALEGERKTMRGIDSAGEIALEVLQNLMKGLGF